MPNPKKEIDMDALNAITDRVLSYTPPPKGEKRKKRAEKTVKSSPLLKETTRVPKPKEG